jgi:ERCC4-related helicase
MEITPYHAKYFAYELTKRFSSDSIKKFAATLTDAQVDLNPHQVDAALFAFRSPLSNGALLADEVGLGKTIEAGIVASQRWAERKRRILVIVPSSLRKQWNQELADKFFLPSVILEAKSFNSEIKKGNLNPFEQPQIIICSFHFARSKEAYVRQTRWDLVVIDEAHRLRNVYKPSNKIGKSIKESLSRVPKLLLTATPLQNSLLELYGLISIIDDYTFGDLKSFKSQFARLTSEDNFDDLKARLQPICKRTLRRQVQEYIKYTNRIAITQEFYPTEEEHRLYNLVSDYLQRPNLYALPRSQRQLMTLILRKLLASSTYAISGTLDALAIKLDAIVQHEENPSNVNVSEELSADFESLEEMEDEWYEEEEDNQPDKVVFTPEQIAEMKNEVNSLRDFHSLAKSISKNSKGEVLLTALKTGFFEAAKRGGQKKAVIFTESRRTQEYLRQVLESTEFAGRIVLFNGSNSDLASREIYQKWLDKNAGTDRISGSRSADIRAAIIEYFRDEAVIMVATEAAAEGINLQFCSMVVNYDLPWNPQRIEQRIGRCHRYGQKHDVVVVNFLNKRNAADQRVYQLLREKFKLFDGVFGASDEVLGTIESGVDFEKRIAEIYLNCRTEDEIQISFNALQAEMEMQIDERMQNTRQKLLENFDEEVNEKLRVSKSESEAYLNKYEGWLWDLTRFYLDPYARFDTVSHSFYLVRNPFPDEQIHPGPYKIGKNIDVANIYRPNHPLAQRLIESCKQSQLQSRELIFQYAGKKITILEEFVGKSGWLRLNALTISSFESEDHLLFCGAGDDGTIIDAEQCERLFLLPAEVHDHNVTISEEIERKLRESEHALETEILQENAERNVQYFDSELEKLDKWAEDIKNSLELELKELDKEIKLRKTESKKILNLQEKVKEQRRIKDLEKKRNELRYKLYQSQDEVENNKEQLIARIEARLKQRTDKSEVFLIRWKIL